MKTFKALKKMIEKMFADFYIKTLDEKEVIIVSNRPHDKLGTEFGDAYVIIGKKIIELNCCEHTESLCFAEDLNDGTSKLKNPEFESNLKKFIKTIFEDKFECEEFIEDHFLR